MQTCTVFANNFNKARQKYNMKKADGKTKSITLSHDSRRFKLVTEHRIIKQSMQIGESINSAYKQDQGRRRNRTSICENKSREGPYTE